MTVTLFEEHSSVLPHWAGLGIQGATVVYLDAHLDLQFVDDTRIERLRQCRSAAELRGLEAEHPYASVQNACFGIEDFLFPAVKLGMVERVVWVAPPHVLRAGLGRSLGKLIQVEGVTIDEIESFEVQPGGWVRGGLMGVELVVCSLEQLLQVDLPGTWLLDIDVDYFVNPPDGGFGVAPSLATATIQALATAPAHVTVSLSIGTGFTPPEFRPIGEDLARRLGWQGAASPESGREGLAVGRQIAATWSRRLPLDRATLMRWQRELSQSGLLGLSPELAVAWVTLGLIQSSAGLLEEACVSDERARSLGVDHPELALELARALVERGDLDAAHRYLSRASGHGSTRARAALLGAPACLAGGRLDEALAWLQRAEAALPANPEVPGLLARAYQRAGDAKRAGEFAAAAQALATRLDRVARRLVH